MPTPRPRSHRAPHTLILALAASVTLLSLVTSCEKRPEGVLSRGRMEDVLYDYHRTQGMLTALPYGERHDTRDYFDAVFRKHHITKAQFDSTMVWYNAHTHDLAVIYEHLQNRFTAENKELQLSSGNSEMSAIIAEGSDTTNLWYDQRLLVLHANELQNLSTFTIKADTSFHATDKFILGATVRFINDGRSADELYAVLALYLRNRQGRTFSQVRRIDANGNVQLTVSQATNDTIESLSGYFYYSGKEDTKNQCAIDNIAVLRMRNSAAPKISPQSAEKTDTLRHARTDTVQRQSQPATQAEPTPRRRIHIQQAPTIRTPNSVGPRRRRPVKRR